jgi:hypothetical protein
LADSDPGACTNQCEGGLAALHFDDRLPLRLISAGAQLREITDERSLAAADQTQRHEIFHAEPAALLTRRQTRRQRGRQNSNQFLRSDGRTNQVWSGKVLDRQADLCGTDPDAFFDLGRGLDNVDARPYAGPVFAELADQAGERRVNHSVVLETSNKVVIEYAAYNLHPDFTLDDACAHLNSVGVHAHR